MDWITAGEDWIEGTFIEGLLLAYIVAGDLFALSTRGLLSRRRYAASDGIDIFCLRDVGRADIAIDLE